MKIKFFSLLILFCCTGPLCIPLNGNGNCKNYSDSFIQTKKTEVPAAPTATGTPGLFEPSLFIF